MQPAESCYTWEAWGEVLLAKYFYIFPDDDCQVIDLFEIQQAGL
jgi:hypothetical protein